MQVLYRFIMQRPIC